MAFWFCCILGKDIRYFELPSRVINSGFYFSANQVEPKKNISSHLFSYSPQQLAVTASKIVQLRIQLRIFCCKHMLRKCWFWSQTFQTQNEVVNIYYYLMFIFHFISKAALSFNYLSRMILKWKFSLLLNDRIKKLY